MKIGYLDLIWDAFWCISPMELFAIQECGKFGKMGGLIKGNMGGGRYGEIGYFDLIWAAFWRISPMELFSIQECGKFYKKGLIFLRIREGVNKLKKGYFVKLYLFLTQFTV